MARTKAPVALVPRSTVDGSCGEKCRAAPARRYHPRCSTRQEVRPRFTSSAPLRLDAKALELRFQKCIAPTRRGAWHRPASEGAGRRQIEVGTFEARLPKQWTGGVTSAVPERDARIGPRRGDRKNRPAPHPSGTEAARVDRRPARKVISAASTRLIVFEHAGVASRGTPHHLVGSGATVFRSGAHVTQWRAVAEGGR